MRRASTFGATFSWRSWRFCRWLLRLLRWRAPAGWCLTLPLRVTLMRLSRPLWDLILFMAGLGSTSRFRSATVGKPGGESTSMRLWPGRAAGWTAGPARLAFGPAPPAGSPTVAHESPLPKPGQREPDAAADRGRLGPPAAGRRLG